METHYVSLSIEPHLVTGQQAEELTKITLGTPEERFIDGVDEEIYFKGSYADCKEFKDNSHASLKNELVVREIPIQ